MFARWRRLDEEGRQGVWRMYGVFTAIMCAGSCVGVATWVVSMSASVVSLTGTVNLREYPFPQRNPNYSLSELLSLLATDYLYLAWFEFLYPVEVLCICIVKLTVLDRMEEFSSPRDDLRRMQRGVKAGRVTMALVVAGCVAGICGGIVAGVYSLHAYSLLNSAASEASNITDDSLIPLFQLLSITDLFSRSQKQNQNAADARSVQACTEAATLLLIIAAFIAVGISSARRIDSVVPLMSTESSSFIKANRLRRQIVTTVAVVFATFLLRAVYVSFYAVSASRQNLGDFCLSRSDLCSTTVTPMCPVPYNEFALMQFFLVYTPELQMIIVLISSPLTLIVALWGMTSGRVLRAMRSKKKAMDTMRDGMLRGEA
jgi:hypothetical protein